MLCLHKAPLIKITAAFFILLLTQANAQKIIPPINSVDSLRQGIALKDSGSYDKARALFEEIPRNDTNYALALFEDAVCCASDNKDTAAIALCNKGLSLSSDLIPNFYMIKAGSLIDLKKYDKAIKLMDAVINKYPNDCSVYFTLGLIYYGDKQYDSAMVALKHAIHLNIFHAQSHYYLALCCLAQGRTIPALLALQFYLLLKPNSSQSFSVVQLIDQVTDNTYQYNDSTSVSPAKYGDQPFSDLALLVKSQVALTKHYKLRTKVNYKLIRQCQLIYDKIKYVPDSVNFCMNTYVPFFIAMRQKKYFDVYAHYIMQSVSDEALQKSIKKYKKKINEFVNWGQSKIENMEHIQKVMHNGKLQTLTCYYYDDHLLQAKGIENDKGVQTGEWTFYNDDNSNLSAQGLLDSNGRRTGVWQWFYNNGVRKERTNYKNGQRSGISEMWYKNGARKNKYTYKGDSANGQSWEYSTSNILASYGMYKNGKPFGPCITYYADGKKQYVLNYDSTGLDSVQREYYATGNILLVEFYKNGKCNGAFTKYWPNGKIKTQGYYKDNQSTGLWKFYYEDGSLQKKTTYINDNPCGIMTTFYHNGKKQEVTTYNNEGNLDGPDTLYDEDGIKYGVLTYKKGMIDNYVYYDKSGKVLSQANAKDKKLYFYTYYPNGILKSQGETIDGLRSGEWKYYSVTGALTTIQSFMHDKLNGNDTDFYFNGSVKEITSYTNDTAEGECKTYYINGTLEAVRWYVAGQYQGPYYSYNKRGGLQALSYYLNGQAYGYTDYYNPTGKLTEEDHYARQGYFDKLWIYDSTGKNVIYTYSSTYGNGHYRLTYTGGQPKIDRTYIAGNTEGQETLYYYNGKVQTEGNYLNGMRQGVAMAYYDNGDTESVYNYINDELYGPAKTYYKENKADVVQNYVAGTATGLDEGYYANGALCYKGQPINNTSVQKYNYYSPDSLLYCTRWYKGDNIIGYSYLGKDGKLLAEIPVEKATCNLTAYFANGNKSLACSYIQGYLNGNRLQYFSNGKVLENQHYKLGYLWGVQTSYYSNGKIRAKENYYMGEKDGKCTYYYANGKIKREGNWLLGDKQGTFNYYNKSGKLLKTAVYYDDDEVYETVR